MALPERTDLSAGDLRIKRLMNNVGMPDSMSLYLAFKQFETEIRLELKRADEQTTSERDDG